MSASEPASHPGRDPSGRPGELTRLVTRLVVAQTVVAAAVGLPFSKRHVPSILFTLGLVAVLAALAVLVRSGTRAGWFLSVGFESAFFFFGLSRFVTSRYVGGTLFALIVAGALLHPAVARAYAVGLGRPPSHVPDQADLGDAAGETFSGRTVG